MKFDFVIGNPPYQEESETESQVNGQKPRKNIFQHFQIQADVIYDRSSVMIYPGIRWMHYYGKGLEKFGRELINDKKLAIVCFYPEAKDVFGNAAELSDGITIVVKNKNKETTGFNYIYNEDNKIMSIYVENPGENLIRLNPNDLEVSRKIREFVKINRITYLHDAILPRTLFGIESDFVSKNPEKVRLYNIDSQIDYSREIRLLTNDKAGKSGRAKWYIANKTVIQKNADLISEWQVAVSSANAGGQKRDNQIEIIDNHSAFGRTRVALRSFKSYDEAKNFYNYAKSYIIRYAFLLTDEALGSLGKHVPDIINYRSDNGFIDFSKDLDSQLFTLIGLNTDERKYVIDKVDNIRKNETVEIK